jgi:thioredoxin-like negative regulator of GroEL
MTPLPEEYSSTDILFFSLDECAPCEKMLTALGDILQQPEYAGLRLQTVKADSHDAGVAALVHHFDIRFYPTVLAFADSVLIGQIRGAVTKSGRAGGDFLSDWMKRHFQAREA